MKFKLPQRTDLLTVEQDYCSLELIGAGFYRYTVRLTVNPVEAQYAKISKIRIFATREPNPKFNSPIFNALNLSTQRQDSSPVDGAEIVAKLLSKEAIERAAVKAAEDSIMLDETLDYTSRFPNNLTGLLSSADKNNSIALGTERKFVNYTVSEVSKQNLPSNSLEQSLQTAADISLSEVSNPKNLANELVFSAGIDPASLIVKERAIKFAPKTFGGVIQTTNAVSVSSRRFLGITNSITATATRKSVSANAVVSVPVTEDKTSIFLEEYLDVPMLSVGKDDFYFVFLAENEFGIPLQKVIKSVNHAKNVALLETPLEPPVFIANSVQVGKNVLQIKQQDPNAFGVAIYRKKILPSQTVYDAEYSLVQKVALTLSHDFILVNDDVSNLNEVFYRAIPYGINEQLSPEFTVATTKALRLPFSSKSVAKNKNFVPFSYELTTSGVDLLLKEIPDNVVTVAFFRGIADKKDASTLIEKPLPVQTSELVVSDTNLQKGRVYRYQYKLFYRNGSEVWGANELLVDFSPEDKNTIETRVSQPRAVSSGNQFDVTFTLQTSVNETQANLVLSALSKQGISQFFSNNIQKRSLNDLIAYNITRTNDFTGETEDLGTMTNPNFSDIRQSGAVGAKAVKPGFKYTYTIRTLLRAPTTVLEDYEQTVTSTTVANKSYSYNPYFWEHPVTLEQGNIVTKNSLKRNHAKTEFGFGNIGKINKVSVSLADVLPVVSEVVAQKFNKTTIKIQWKINGPSLKVDHYIVTLEVLGMKTIVGKRHNISDSNYFEFIDILRDHESGMLVYGITPVYYDYGRGTTTKANGLVI